MRIINIIYGIYGIAIAAAHAVGTNSGSGQHNNDTLVKHNLNNNLEDACDGSDCSITDNRIGHQAMHNGKTLKREPRQRPKRTLRRRMRGRS